MFGIPTIFTPPSRSISEGVPRKPQKLKENSHLSPLSCRIHPSSGNFGGLSPISCSRSPSTRSHSSSQSSLTESRSPSPKRMKFSLSPKVPRVAEIGRLNLSGISKGQERDKRKEELDLQLKKLYESVPLEIKFEPVSPFLLAQGDKKIEIHQRMQNATASSFKNIYEATLSLSPQHTDSVPQSIVVTECIVTGEGDKRKLKQKIVSIENEVKMALFFHQLTEQKIRTPNLVQTSAVAFRFGRQTHVYTVMPKISGGNFQSLSKNPSFEKRLQGCLEFAKGLLHLHQLRIVHNDLKGENALIEDLETGVVKLIDWGTHVNFNEFSPENAEEFIYNALRTLGTEPYYAPERIAATGINKSGLIKIKGEGANSAIKGLYDVTNSKVDPLKLEAFLMRAEYFSACLVFYFTMVGEFPAYIQKIINTNQELNLTPTTKIEGNKYLLMEAQRPLLLSEAAILKARRTNPRSKEELQHLRQTPKYLKAKACLEVIWRGLSFNPPERTTISEVVECFSSLL